MRLDILWYLLSTATIASELKSDIETTNDTPYLALMGELNGVYCKDLEENLRRYNSTVLY